MMKILSIFASPLKALAVRFVIALLIGTRAFKLNKQAVELVWDRYVTQKRFWETLADNTDLLAMLYSMGSFDIFDLSERECSRFSKDMLRKAYADSFLHRNDPEWIRRLWNFTKPHKQAYLLYVDDLVYDGLSKYSGRLYSNSDLFKYIEDPKVHFGRGTRVLVRTRANKLYDRPEQK